MYFLTYKSHFRIHYIKKNNTSIFWNIEQLFNKFQSIAITEYILQHNIFYKTNELNLKSIKYPIIPLNV